VKGKDVPVHAIKARRGVAAQLHLLTQQTLRIPSDTTVIHYYVKRYMFRCFIQKLKTQGIYENFCKFSQVM